MIVIIGGRSRLGHATAKLLLAEGKPLRVTSRTPEALENLRKLGAEVVAADLRQPHTLARACEDTTRVLATTHSFAGKGNSAPQLVDDLGNRRLIDAAKAAGVEHFVFTSIYGVSPDSPIDFFRIKYEIEQYLKASGLSYTILRPGPYMQEWAALVGKPILQRGKTTIFGGGKTPINFVSFEDVARYAVIALEDPRARNRTLDIGGPENLTLDEVADLFAGIAGRPAKKRHVPLPLMRVMSTLTEPINRSLSRLIRAGIFMDTAEQRIDITSLVREFGVTPTRLEEVARQEARATGGATT